MNGLALCAGVGGLDLGVAIAVRDYRTVCFVEREAFAAATLAGAMANGVLAPAPVWDDLFSFDGVRWRGIVDLSNASENWPTCRSSDGEKGGPNQRGSKGDAMLEPTALHWPTAKANDHMTENLRGNLTLNGAAKKWATPNGFHDSEKYNTRVNVPGRQTNLSGHALHFPQVEATSQDGAAFSDMPLICCLLSLPKRKLNPRFDECLMGWPVNWSLQCATESTGLGPAAMASYLLRQRWLLSRLLENWD